MGQALYRKYRSKSLSEIVGQDAIVETLQNSIKNDKISHAYLFTGPRGVGKTSIARILAYEVNGLKYDESATTLDIIEIDAASNRRIDEIRELRDKVHIAPTSAKYKVYIIDEVHMLTKEAFNALLKTLEEPPEHAIFILATTESHKLPDTIISRTQRFTFKAIEPTDAVKHLKVIAKKEGITIDDDALELLAEHGDGSFRDSISLFEQVSHNGEITGDQVRSMLGLAPNELITKLYETIFNGSAANLLDSLKSFQEQGYEPVQVAKQLAQYTRTQLMEEKGHEQPENLVKLLKELLLVPASVNPNAFLEVTLLGFNIDASEAGPKHPPAPAAVEVAVKPEEVIAEPIRKPKVVPVDADQPTMMKAWADTVQDIKKKYNTLYGILRMAEPHFEDGQLILTCQFPFHQKRLNEAKNIKIIQEGLAHHLGGAHLKIKCEVKTKTTSKVETISNIFGGAEVLES